MAEASAYQKFNEAAEVSAFPKFNDTDKLSGEEDPSFHPGNPYVHKPGQDNGGLIKLVDVLHNNLRGGVYSVGIEYIPTRVRGWRSD